MRWLVLLVLCGAAACGDGGGAATDAAVADAPTPPPDSGPDAFPCRATSDMDGDDLPDSVEGCFLDFDGDGMLDYLDADSDDDGLDDGQEDLTHDGYLDAFETNPRDPDSDDDGYGDLIEVVSHHNGRDPKDTPEFEIVVTLPMGEPEQTVTVNFITGGPDPTGSTIDADDPNGFIVGTTPGLVKGTSIDYGVTLANTTVASAVTPDAFEIMLSLGDTMDKVIAYRWIYVVVPGTGG